MAQTANHGRLLLQRLHQQREMDFLCDITIMVKDAEFRAHRNILAAFSDYFSVQAEKGEEFTTLDPEKVSRYSLEKLLEFIYTGQMNLSSTRQAAVRRAAIFLGMSDATKYLEKVPCLSESGETSQSDADKEAEVSPPSPGSPTSPVPLSIAAVVGGLKEEVLEGKIHDFDPHDGDLETGDDDDYTPSAPRGVGRPPGRKRGRRPKSFGGEPAEQSGSGDGAPKIHRGRGRPRGSGRGRGGAAPRGDDLSAGDSDGSAKELEETPADLGDTSADWSPSREEEPAAKKPRPSGGGGVARDRKSVV